MSRVLAATPPHRVRAAQYVRMSTDPQEYSPKNQMEVIAAYAERRGFEIVRTYQDSGKSGLSLKGRESLRRLIADVCDGSADFSAVLVYDVSRWGRFQDADESAHYEFLCRSAGIKVEYCAEMFDNDGSLSATIMKGLKRVMAAEYSRDLSVKVFQGQSRLARMGFRVGGSAGYGLRRVLLDKDRKPKTVLRLGERKSLTTDRVALVPGPRREVAVVRKIFRLFVEHDLSLTQIATMLNAQGIAADKGGSWDLKKVRSILSNEKYIGNCVYNRVSVKLKTKLVANPADEWVRHDEAFQPLVTTRIFAAAQKRLSGGVPRHSDQGLLDSLRRLLEQNGSLSATMIDKSKTTPCCDTYRKRFGNLVHAWSLIGYTHTRRRDFDFVAINRKVRALRPIIVSKVIGGIEAAGVTVTRDLQSDLLTINDSLRAYVSISRYLEKDGLPCWYIPTRQKPQRDLTILVRLSPNNVDVLDYYLLPQRRKKANFTAEKELRTRNQASMDRWRCDDLSAFFDLTHCIQHSA